MKCITSIEIDEPGADSREPSSTCATDLLLPGFTSVEAEDAAAGTNRATSPMRVTDFLAGCITLVESRETGLGVSRIVSESVLRIL